MLAAAAIRAGDGDVYVAGGMESMNSAPFLLRKARFGYRLGNGTLDDCAVLDGLWCGVEDCHMGTHAERVAIQQPRVAVRTRTRSRSRATSGRSRRRTPDGSTPRWRRSPVRDAKGRETVVTVDEGPRARLDARGAGEAHAGVRRCRAARTGRRRRSAP